MTPLALLSTWKILRESYRTLRDPGPPPTYPAQKKAWAERMLSILKVDLQVTGAPTLERPVIFVGNHISYLDIILLIEQVPDISFVAKRELASWPIFGHGAKKFGTIFVHRESTKGRGEAYREIESVISQERKGVLLFPSGTTTLDESKPWKLGAFRMAHRLGIPIQPFRLSYEPLRRAAYIDDDVFAPHLLALCRGGRMQAKLEFATPAKVENPVEDCERWRAWTADFLRAPGAMNP